MPGNQPDPLPNTLSSQGHSKRKGGLERIVSMSNRLHLTVNLAAVVSELQHLHLRHHLLCDLRVSDHPLRLHVPTWRWREE